MNILYLTGSFYMLQVYDRVIPSRSVPTLIALSVLAASLYAGQAALDFFRNRVLSRLARSLDERLSLRVFALVARLPLAPGGGSLGLQPMRDLDQVRGFLAGGGPIGFPAELMQRRAETAIADLPGEEEPLFATRRTARDGHKAQLKERIGQLREQIQGMADQVTAKQREISLIGDELRGVRELYARNLVPIARVTALERDAARLEGERGALVSSIAGTKGKVTETELQILQVDQDLHSEVDKDLSEIRGRLSELVEKRVAAEDQLKRVEIRAPQDGVVHRLAVHTVGGVVGPGEALMLVVPRSDALTVEAKIQPQDIDQVRIGHRAVLRFSAFNQRTTPELAGEVRVVSADVSLDQKTGASFYTVRIRPAEGELDRLHGLRLVAGMPVESFIQTGERTVVSYLTRPLTDQITKAWREK